MKKTLILDSSQIQSYLECPQKWYYSRVENIMPIPNNNFPESEISTPAIQGSYGHKLLERYYKSLSKGFNLKDSMDWALSIKADELCECGHELILHTVISEVDGVKITACNGIGCKCSSMKASAVEITAKEKVKVGSRFQDYCFTYSSNELIPPAPEAVEVGFSHIIYEDDDYLFILEGKIDLFKPTRKEVEYGFVDHKFQLRERNLYKKSIQFRNYGLVTNAKIALINYIRLKDKIDKTTLIQVPITWGLGEHDWWHQKLIKYFFEIQQHLESLELGIELPKNWGMCSGMFGYPCDYTDLCNERDPGLLLAKKSQLFQLKPEWKPW